MRGLVALSSALVAVVWVASCGLDENGTGPDADDAGAEVGGPDTALDVSPAGDADDAGDGGAIDAPLDSTTCDASLRDDPHHCGRCAHDCLGGACVAGLCAPVVLATGIDQPAHMAVDSTTVYVTSRFNGGDVWAVPKAGVPDGGVSPRLATNYVDPNRIAVALTFAVFTNQNTSGSVRRCTLPPDGICGGPALDVSLSNADGIATDGTIVYYAVTGLNEILTCPAVGCNQVSTALVQALRAPAAVAVVGGEVFFTERGDNGAYTNGRVEKCKTTGCNNTPILLADNQADPQSLGVFGGTVFWGNSGSGTTNDGAILSCSAAACATPTKIATTQFAMGDIAVDSTGVYWTSFGAGAAGAVLRCPTAGCAGAAPTVIAPANAPGAIAIDSQAIYWTSFTDRTLSKIAR